MIGTLRRAAVVTSLAAATACGSAATSSMQPTHSASHATPPSDGHWITTTFQGYFTMVVTHPSDWKNVAGPSPTPGPEYTLGYLTNQPTHAPCQTTPLPAGGAEGSCPGPVSNLPAGGVLLSATESIGNPTDTLITNANTVIDGQPVFVQSNAGQDCPAGTTGSLNLTASAPTSHKRTSGLFLLQICYNASGSSNTSAQVERVLHTLRFS